MKKKVILFGIDGGTWRLIDKFIKEGAMPNFAYLLENGAKGTLMSTVPALTLPAWTSIFTGVNPGKHGMTDFLIRVNGKFELATSNFRQSESLWKILTRNGLRSIIINDPVTYPPERINGIMTTGLLTPPYSSYVYPAEVANEIESVVGGYEPDLPPDYYELATTNKPKAYSMLHDFASKIAKATLHLANHHEWDLLAPIITSTDKLQHFFWNDEDYIRRHYVWLDHFLKDLIDLSHKHNADLLLVSDHGFGPAPKALYINQWLYEMNFQKIKRNILLSLLSTAGITRPRLIKILRLLHAYKFAYWIAQTKIKGLKEVAAFYDKPIDFKNSMAYSESEGIFINDNIASNDYEKVRNLIIRQLYEIEDNGVRVVDKVYKREEVIQGKFIQRAPDIFVLLHEGYVSRYWSNSVNGSDNKSVSDAEALKSGSVESGGHRPEGIFAAYGSNIRAGLTVNHIVQTWDITPTILHMLGLPIQDYMDGKVLEDIFHPTSEPAKRPVNYKSQSEAYRIRKLIRMQHF